MNGTMLQGFSWYLDADGGHWRRLAEDAQLFADNGITAVWLPPAYKGMAGANDVGYGVYDTYDLGEFDQKGSVRTKYGTRAEYLRAIRALRQATVVLVDDLVAAGVLRYVRQSARIVHCGKRGGAVSTQQGFIEAMLVTEALHGERAIGDGSL